jgi:putative transposase
MIIWQRCRKPKPEIIGGGHMDESSLSHTLWKCQYHIVFIPKYRKKVMYGQVKADIREIIKVLCKYKKVEIIEGAICSDHVHLCVSIPPKLSISDFMGYLKGKSALMIHDKHPEMANKWNREFWARGYYVATVGNITEEAIKRYIQDQEEESKAEDTRR